MKCSALFLALSVATRTRSVSGFCTVHSINQGSTASINPQEARHGVRCLALFSSRRGSSRRGSGGSRRPRPSAGPIPSPGQPGRGCFRETLRPGMDVYVVLKKDQRSGAETLGTVQRILTNSPFHPHGIKVMLASGQVGRVTRFAEDEDESP